MGPEPHPLALVPDARLEGKPRPARRGARVARQPLLIAAQLLLVGMEPSPGDRLRVGAEEQPQEPGVPELGERIVGRLGPPRRQRLAAVVGQGEETAPAAARSRRSER